jgi:hypothetical protein
MLCNMYVGVAKSECGWVVEFVVIFFRFLDFFKVFYKMNVVREK